MGVLSSFFVNNRKKVLSLVVLGAIAWGSSLLFGPDNKVEQGAEAIIKTETGVDVDFTPQK